MSTDTRLNFPIDDIPKNGESLKIADGLTWVRMPLPMSLNHINLWLIGENNDQTLVDTGMHLPEVVEKWTALINKESFSIKRVFITHMHPDHVGMGGWFVDQHNCEFMMSRTDYLQCRVLSADKTGNVPQVAIDFYKKAGMKEEALERYVSRFGFFGSIIYPLPSSYQRVKDGDIFNFGEREWKVLEGSGHTMEHLCLYSLDEEYLISGDQILPTISSHVGVFPTEPEANPLEDWINSCKRLKSQVNEEVLVLPAHGRPFIGAHKRLDALINLHEANLESLHDLLKEPRKATETFSVLFNREIDENNFLMALGESLAHLNCLEHRGSISKDLIDGVYHYEAN